MTILLVDDHVLFREGIALLLATLEANVHVLEAGTCGAALDIIAETEGIDIVLMDIQLPDASGLSAIATIRERYPSIPVIAVSSNGEKEAVLAALDAGAMGYIPKSSPSAVLKGALQLVLSKGIYLPPSAFLTHVSRPPSKAPVDSDPTSAEANPVTPETLGLTTRQAEVLFRILQGKSTKLISRELSLSTGTVKAHTSAVLRALNVTTRTQAVVAAGKIGLRFTESRTPA
jgi:DNA-binding NarL/FixJ family response regulator